MKKEIPVIYIYVEGGLIQGISSTGPVGIEIFDKDNFEVDPESQSMSLDEWNEMIRKKTETGEIKPIY